MTRFPESIQDVIGLAASVDKPGGPGATGRAFTGCRGQLAVICWGLLLGGVASAQSSVDELVSRGNELFHSDIGCWVCHGPTAEGLVGPTLHFGPDAGGHLRSAWKATR